MAHFPPRSTSTASALIVALVAAPAFADLWGADLGPLSTLVSQAATQIAQIADTLSTLRKTYDEAKRVAGYADDAVKSFKAFQKSGAEMFRDGADSALDRAFPDLAYFRSEASRTGPWAQGTGELQLMVSYCVRGGLTGPGCTQVQEALTLKQARSALSATFGTTPPVAGAVEIRAMDHEAAMGMATSSAQVGRDAIARQQAKGLMERCTGGTDDDSIAACQAAANAASILGVEQGADVADQLAEANRLQAVRVAQENGKRKRETNEAIERRQLILDGAQRMGAEPMQVKTEGLEVF